MIRGLKELFPEYLDGDNISNHCSILDTQDTSVEGKVSLLGTWNNLRRPILIEKIQSEDAVAIARVHVHTPSPIRSVRGVGDFASIDEEYLEEELVTDAVFEVTVHSTSPVVFVDGTVSVETYDDTVYVKGYPENDVKEANNKDHDEFLDLIGALLNVPRRVYKIPSTITSQYYLNTFPSYFVKSESAPYWTEDDYYYSQRLQKFCDGVNRKDFIVHIAEVLYNWDDSSISHCKNRNTFLYDELEELVGENTVYDILTTLKKYSNIDYGNIQDVVSNYHPVTRLLFAIASIYLLWGVIGGYDDTTHTLVFNIATKYIDAEGNNQDVENAVFDVTYYNFAKEILESETVTCDEFIATCTKEVWHDHVLAGIKPHYMYEIANGEQYDEIITNTLTNYQTYSLEDYVELIGETNLVQKPFNLTNWYCTYDEETGESNKLNFGKLYLGKLCNNFTPSLPDGDFLVHLKFYTTSSYDDSKLGDTAEIVYLNNVDGKIVLRVEAVQGSTYLSTSWNLTVEEYTGGTVTSTSTYNLFDLYGGGLMLERKGNRITFACLSADHVKILHQRTYTNLSVNGCLYIRNLDKWQTRLTRHYRYRIGEYNSDKTDLPVYKADQWAFISRGTGSTDPIFTDDGQIQCATYSFHTWKQALDTTKTYNIYFYKHNQTFSDMYIGVVNNNTAIPTRAPTQNANQSNGVTTGINKATITYDTTEQKWFVSFNDGIAIAQMEDNQQRYLAINTPSGASSSNNRILAITEQTNGGGAIVNKYNITKQADNDSHPFTHDTFTEENTGKPTINADGSLKVGTGFITDWFRYNNDENWIINTEIQINTLNTSTMGIATDNIGDGHNFGVWNIHAKWIDFNDNTSSGSQRITLNQISYDTGSTLQIRITREGNTVTWRITDDNGNTQTVPLQNITQSSNTRGYMRANGATTDIDMLNYTRLTKIEEEEEE